MEHGKNDLHYCQRTTASGIAVYDQRGRTESVWKWDIRLDCKALRLKGSEADRLHYVQLGKLAVVKASNQNKALADFQGEPRRASADSNTSLPVRLTSLYIRIPKTTRTEPGKND